MDSCKTPKEKKKKIISLGEYLAELSSENTSGYTKDIRFKLFLKKKARKNEIYKWDSIEAYYKFLYANGNTTGLIKAIKLLQKDVEKGTGLIIELRNGKKLSNELLMFESFLNTTWRCQLNGTMTNEVISKREAESGERALNLINELKDIFT